MRNIFKLIFLLQSIILIYHPESKAHKLTFKLALLSMAKLNCLNLSWKSTSKPHNTTSTHLLCLSWSFTIPQHCTLSHTFLAPFISKFYKSITLHAFFHFCLSQSFKVKKFPKKKTHNNLIKNQHLGICKEYFDIWSQLWR